MEYGFCGTRLQADWTAVTHYSQTLTFDLTKESETLEVS